MKAVILARGLGTRMKHADGSAILDERQTAAADAGMKGMIPIVRPFMDYVLAALADAGFSEVCLVIGPEHDAVRNHYAHGVELDRLLGACRMKTDGGPATDPDRWPGRGTAPI